MLMLPMCLRVAVMQKLNLMTQDIHSNNMDVLAVEEVVATKVWNFCL